MPKATYVRIAPPEGLQPLSLETSIWRAAVGIGKNYTAGGETYDLVAYYDAPITLTAYALKPLAGQIQEYLAEHAFLSDNTAINDIVFKPLGRLVALIGWTVLADGVLNVSAPEEAKP